MKVEYGPKCAELARWLLATQAFRTEQDITALAERIQRSIEDWLHAWDARPGTPPQTVGRTPAECAIAMNNLTPEQVGRAMEKLPTDALEWAVKFEALSHPSLGQISGEVSEVKTAPAGGKE